MNVNVVMLGAGIALVLLGLVVLVVVRRRGATTAAAPDAADPVPTVELLGGDSDPEAPMVADAAEVRALKAHVRVLEEALQRAAEVTVEQPELAAYRTQVRVAVDAVARRTADAGSRAAVARVAAAIARLDADPARRTLLPVPAGRPFVVAPAAPAPAPEPSAALESAPAHTEAVDERSPEIPEAQEVPVPDVVMEEEVVLPVPPPAPAETRRMKRRLRRSAA